MGVVAVFRKNRRDQKKGQSRSAVKPKFSSPGNRGGKKKIGGKGGGEGGGERPEVIAGESRRGCIATKL